MERLSVNRNLDLNTYIFINTLPNGISRGVFSVFGVRVQSLKLPQNPRAL